MWGRYGAHTTQPFPRSLRVDQAVRREVVAAQYVDVVPLERGVCRHERYVQHVRLRDEQPIEPVAVMLRQRRDRRETSGRSVQKWNRPPPASGGL